MTSTGLVLRAVVAMVVLAANSACRRSEEGPGDESPAVTERSPAAGNRLFDEVFARIRASSVDPLDDQELYRRAAEGMIEELDDPYAMLRFPNQRSLPPGDQPLPSGMFLDRRDGLLVAVATLPGSPADSAGIRPGDIIVNIDSVAMNAFRLDRAATLLEGPPGTSVAVRVRKPSGRIVSLTMRRAPARDASLLQATSLGNGVGLLRLTRLGPGVADSASRAIAGLRERGVQRLVLDLRGSVQGGGDQRSGAELADLFLDRGSALVVNRMRRASGTPRLVDSAASPFAGMPLAVLIDGGTAGAAEVAAGALQDHDRAVVIGAPSFGRGVTQSTFSLGGGAELTLTTAVWMTPNGRQIQRPPRTAPGDSVVRPTVRSDAGRVLVGGGGIVPDRMIADGAGDPVLAEARRVLTGATTVETVFALLNR